MTIEILNRANAIKKVIDNLESEKRKISKLFEKKETLSDNEIKELFEIAMINTDYSLKKMKQELERL